MNKYQKNEIYDSKVYNNIKEVVNEAIVKYPNNIAFKIKNKDEKGNVSYTEITYKKFGEEINALGTALINNGLKNKRIAIIGKNSYEWILTYLAVVNGVGIAVPLDKGLPEQEIESLLQRSYSDAVVFAEEYCETMEKIKKQNNCNVSKYICMKKTDVNGLNLVDLIEQGQVLLKDGNKEYIESEIDNEKMSIILFTSGTTSLSKAVMLSHKNIASNITALNKAEKILSTDVNMAFLPFHHTFGSTGILLFLNNGATNVFCDGIRYIQQNLKEYKVSVFVCVPLLLEAMYKKIMKEIEKQGKTKLIKIAVPISNFLLKMGIDIRRKLFKSIIDNLGGKLRFIVSGASGIDKNVAKGFNNFGILTVQGYGLTETSPVLTAENEKCIKYGSIGYPISGVEIKIEDKDENGVGEIIAKGPNVMLGYYENEEATKEVLKDGWFYTGDLGKVDKDGYIFITGRKKNVIVLKNGKNVFPEELEVLINNLPYVVESMVFGFPKDDDLVVSVKLVYNKDYFGENYKGKTFEDFKKDVWNDIKQINSGLTNYKHIKKLILSDEEMIKTSTAKIKRFKEIEKVVKEVCN